MHRNLSWRFIVLSTFFMANLTPLFGVHMQYGVLWSLAVEEHFYLFWPFIVKVFSRIHIAICAGLIVVAVPILRAITFTLGYTAGPGYTWLVADGLALGSLLAIVIRSNWPERAVAKYFFVICISVSILLLVAGSRWGVPHGATVPGATLRPTALNLFFAGTLAAILLIGTGPCRSLVRWSVLQFFGKISYGLYLIHLLSFEFVDKMFATFFPLLVLSSSFALVCLRFLIAGGLAVGIAFLSRTYFEEWFLQFKNRRAHSVHVNVTPD
jgi:peptidoglycan/LPS O-acetylase OafA/YrhL